MITRRLIACTPAVFWSRARDSSLHPAASPAAVLFIAVNLTRIPLAVHTLLLHFSCAQTLPWILVVLYSCAPMAYNKAFSIFVCDDFPELAPPSPLLLSPAASDRSSMHLSMRPHQKPRRTLLSPPES